ncbi:MAG: secondary thiamine-phosphate synthase enzyme YjbQ [Actinobacteria bacterium]|nr:secondary thiamine-phosphate synthase enzyme YjbQ [Actinomycetota bacterium]
MKTKRITVDTGQKRGIVDLTQEVESFVRSEGDGLLNIFLPHATAGLVLLELGSGSESDLFDRLDELLPRANIYSHRHGAEGHGADHLLPAFVSPSLTVPVVGGKVLLGTWQSIALIDTNVDNPRREVLFTFLESHD